MSFHPARYSSPINYQGNFYKQSWYPPLYGAHPPPYGVPRPPLPPQPFLYNETPHPFGGGFYYGSDFSAPALSPAFLPTDFSIPPPNLPFRTVTPQSGEPGSPSIKPGISSLASTPSNLHKFSPDAPVFVPKSQHQHPVTSSGDFQNNLRTQVVGRHNGEFRSGRLQKDDTVGGAGDLQNGCSTETPEKHNETKGPNYKHSNNNYHANRYPKFQQHGQHNDVQNHNGYPPHKFQSRDLHEIPSGDVGKTNGGAGGREPFRKNKNSVAQMLKKSSNVPRAPWHDVSEDTSPSPPLDDDSSSRYSSPKSFNGQSDKLEQENAHPDRGFNAEDSSPQNIETTRSFNGPLRENPEYAQTLNGSRSSVKDRQHGPRSCDEINTVEYYNSSIRSSGSYEHPRYSRGRGGYRGAFARGLAHEVSFSGVGNDRYGHRGYSRDDSHGGYSRDDSYRGYSRDDSHGSYSRDDSHGGYSRDDSHRGFSRDDSYSRDDSHRGYSRENSHRGFSRDDSHRGYSRDDSHVNFRGKYRGNHRSSAGSRGDFRERVMPERNEWESTEMFHGSGGSGTYSSRHNRRPVDHDEYAEQDFNNHRSEKGSRRNPRFDSAHAARGDHSDYVQQDLNSQRSDRGSYQKPRFDSTHSSRGVIRRAQYEHVTPSHEIRDQVNPAHKNEVDQRRHVARPNHGDEGYRSRVKDWSAKQKKTRDGQQQEPATRQEPADDLETKLAKNRMSSRQKMLLLDDYNSDLNLIVDANGYGASALDNPDGFLRLWADIKATHGAGKGRLYFEVKVIELLRAEDVEKTDPCPHAVRVGWSTERSTFEDGTGSWCLDYHGKTEFIEGRGYCESSQAEDVLGAILDLESRPATVTFLKNGVAEGDPSILADFPPVDPATALFPHISLKNSKVRVNFGQRDTAWFPPPEGTSFIGQVPMEDLVPSLSPPERKSDCEIVMLIGLPGSGKTTWALRHQREHPEKRYNILGTDQLMELLNCDTNGTGYSTMFDQFKDVAKSCFERLLRISAMKVRNYVIDQTNVYRSARRRKLSGFTAFRKTAVVIQPSNGELSRRSKERTLGSGKTVPEGVLRDMKANFALPDEDAESFHVIEYVCLQENDARELVESYNVEGRRNKPLLSLD